MRNLKNSVSCCIALVVACSGSADAATLISFDRPNLVIVYDNNGTYGYYTGASKKTSAFSDIEMHECTFMFMRVEGQDEVTVRSFNRPIKNWNAAAYSDGSIRVDGENWQIKFSDRPTGCSGRYDSEEITVPPGGPGLNAAEHGARGAHYKLEQKSKVVGIRWVEFEAAATRRIGRKFSAVDRKIGAGTLVVELRKIGTYSEIQYLDLNTNKLETFWVNSSTLINPFPRR